MSAASDEAAACAMQALPQAFAASASLWLDQLREQGGEDLLDALSARQQLAAALRLVACSDYAGRMLHRHWQWFAAAVRDGAPQRAADTGGVPPAGDDAAFMRWLRERRNRALPLILWRDLLGLASVPETLAALSALADDLIRRAATHAGEQLAQRHGRVRRADGAPVPLVILAMGKLGGGELNVSSDVDLIYLYPHDGDSDGERVLAADAYFARFARRITALLEEVTADGFVYRVDTRLRPFGDSGPPVTSFAALESYLVNHGRSWERYAFVKARVVVPADDRDILSGLQDQLIEPFVYRRYLDFGVFEALRDMKSMITAEVRRREMAGNVKLGPGGIREIEFIVQSLQLVRGGSMPQLQQTGLREALAQLESTRMLTRQAAAGLDASYCFLRRLENFLQGMSDRQTHDLPVAEHDRARAALAMGFDGWTDLSRELDRHRRFVSEQFARVAFRTEGDDTHETSAIEAAIGALAERDAAAADWQALFERFAYRDAAGMAAEMQAFLGARSTRQIDATASRRLIALIPALLALLQSRAQPAATLRRLFGILGAILRRSAYVALLNENPPVLSRLVDLCEQSAYLAEEIARFPLLLDEMLDPRLYSARLSAEVLRDDLAARLTGFADDDSERQVEALAQFQRAALFRIAAADFSGQLPIMKVSDRLTELAEIVLDRALGIAWHDLTRKHGEPCFSDGGTQHVAGLGVIAYGKLGGIELSYGSDLDLVFLHNSRGEQQQTRGPKSIGNDMFFVRLARRLVHFLTVQTASGALYEVDTRLRPSGRSGLLVTNLDAFERYQAENAWTWEHQALLRARPVAGSARVAREFERVRTHTLEERVNRDSLRDEVRRMREKMRAELDRGDAQTFDLKQGTGGIADIEFLVQYLVLLNARRCPAVIHYSDNIRQLGTLGASGCMDAGEARRLQEIYRCYRTHVHRLLLDEQQAVAPAAPFAGEREYVSALWARVIG